MMNSPTDYWDHRQRQQMQQAQPFGADESHLPPHLRGGGQIGFQPSIAPIAATPAPPAIPQLAALVPHRPAMPLRRPPVIIDPRDIPAAFLRGELDSQG